MRLKVRNGTEARTRRGTLQALRLGNRCHDGRMSFKGRALTRGLCCPLQPRTADLYQAPMAQ
ncbi:hypothetical protein APY04_1358 [Hyphomicrobium sulfonivorans]|uniref:Uncharacterized protein n=1 Tax=Hyphomicrobium sulfonivorans TaxID=121290 RepID=A0A109BIT1_HYPSL|nr:hypothetical protein APY04_1358 [Hyphomicrobium sulfonivorans]